jgi:hypothetical protein
MHRHFRIYHTPNTEYPPAQSSDLVLPVDLVSIREFCEKFWSEGIINMAETAWLKFQGEGKVMAEKGTKEVPVVPKGMKRKVSRRLARSACPVPKLRTLPLSGRSMEWAVECAKP